MNKISKLNLEDIGTVADGLEAIETYKQKVKDGHTFTLEEVEEVKQIVLRVQALDKKLNSRKATKKKRKKRK